MATPRYEVRTDTLCQGWVNCWFVHDADATEPETFDSIEAARAAIDEHIEDMREAYAAGDMGDGEEFNEEGEREQLAIFVVGAGQVFDA